ncbi:hypothetical protein [Streptomyces sp. HUAS TT7]|uniref:hypothetical protein n=1 Tax=Streptomyces sp. HUAS TT7 TaxID=3447507 RepID=UPI003F6584B9
MQQIVQEMMQEMPQQIVQQIRRGPLAHRPHHLITPPVGARSPMLSYQLRDPATRQLLARGLVDYAGAEAALDRLDDEMDHALAANGEGARRIRLRLDVEKVTGSITETLRHHVLLLGVSDHTDPPHAL